MIDDHDVHIYIIAFLKMPEIRHDILINCAVLLLRLGYIYLEVMNTNIFPTTPVDFRISCDMCP